MCNACATQEATGQVSSQQEKQVSKRATAPAVVAPDAEYFSGVIKSYNERRGFGFLACDETAKRFGRDVYLSKIESLAAIQEGERQLQEGDYVRFAVVPSTEGFPQAAAAQRIYMHHGTVLNFCRLQGGAIACSAGEVVVRPGDCGCLWLHPGDEVSFCLESQAGGAPREAKLLKLLHTLRPVSSLLGCFSFEFPRDGLQSVPLDGHAFASCICFSGLPSDLGEAELNKFFVKLGAAQVTVAHSPNGGFASVHFPSVSSMAHFLSAENHSFTEETNTVLVCLQPCRTQGAQTLPALPPPSLVQGDSSGVLVCWEPVSIATAYKVEIRTAGAGSWSPVDAVGRVQPAGATPLLGLQSTCLAMSGLSAGLPYEARVSYVASCGCHCSPSDPSFPCSAGVQSSSPQSPPPAPCAPPMVLHSPPQPEVRLSHEGNAIFVRWSTVGILAAGYALELRQGSTSVSSRFACQAPADNARSVELCIQGLQPGQSYIVCVRSVAQDGFESVPSAWSCWVTLPIVLQPFDPMSCGNTSMGLTSAPVAPQQQPLSPYSILFDEVSLEKPDKQLSMVMACPAPEITGHEEVLFLD